MRIWSYLLEEWLALVVPAFKLGELGIWLHVDIESGQTLLLCRDIDEGLIDQDHHRKVQAHDPPCKQSGSGLFGRSF